MLAMWRMSGLADALELVVSELVANGIRMGTAVARARARFA
jgi:hypothetical protein